MYKVTKIFYVLAALFVTSCSDFQIEPDVYTGEESMNDMDTYACTVLSRRSVQVSGYNANNNIAGGLIGAIAGGAVGNAFGGGHGRSAMTAVGALGGAAAGSAIQESTKQSRKMLAYEYTVKLDINGRLKTVVQSRSVMLKKGERAYLVMDRKRSERSRLIPME